MIAYRQENISLPLPIGCSFRPVSDVGDKIRGLIPADRGEQKALAHLAGIRTETLNKIVKGKTKEPGFITVAKIVRAKGISLDKFYDGDLPQPIATPRFDTVTVKDRRRMREFATWLLELSGDDKKANLPKSGGVRIQIIEDDFTFPIGRDEFMAKDFDYPQPWHYFAKRRRDEGAPPSALPLAAHSPGVEPPHGEADVVRFLNPRDAGGDVSEIFDRVHQIVRVVGDSMEMRYFNGDLLRVDTRVRDPRAGQPVAIYSKVMGGSLLGLYERQGDRVILRKENKRHPDVILPETGWILLGPVVAIVERLEG